jgi:glycosyltransferase 2 family protein
MSESSLPPETHPARWRTLLRAVWLVAAAVVVGLVLANRWEEVGPVLGRLSLGTLAVGAVAGLVAAGVTGAMWNTLLAGVGGRLPFAAATTVFFVGQVGKYLPVGIWPLVAQMELGRDYGLRPRITASAFILFSWVHLVTGVAVAFIGLAAAGLVHPLFALAVLPCLALLIPGPLGWALSWGLRLLRREPLPRLPQAGTMVRAGGWSALMWACYAIHILALTAASGGGLGLLHAAGAFAAAWVVGYVVVIAPAGTGPREAAMTAALLPVVGTGVALSVTVVSRLVLVTADALWAVLGLALRRLGR